MKNILIISAVFPPEQVTSAYLNYDLAKALAKDYNVTVLRPKPTRPIGASFQDNWSDPDFETVWIDSYTHPESELIGRFNEARDFSKKSVEYLKAHKDEIDFVYNDGWQLFGLYIIAKACVKYNVPYIVPIQDIYPECLLTKSHIPGFAKKIIEGILLPIDKYYQEHAYRVRTISDEMADYLSKTRGVERSKYLVVNNWQNDDDFMNLPVVKKSDKIVFEYVGSINVHANVDLMIRAFAEANTDTSQTEFHILGGMSALSKGYDDNVVLKELQENAGIGINWETMSDSLSEQVNIRIAGNELPDAFMGVGFSNYNLTSYGEDGTFIDLTPYLTEEYMPNLAKILDEHPEIKSAFGYAKETGKKVHLMGLTSDGGVHSSLEHLFKLIEIGKSYGLKNQVFVHCFMDGRDTDPHSGKGFIEQVGNCCSENDAAIASIVGRFYAMDRDKRWNRVKEAYDLLVEGKGKQADDMVKAMEESYAEGVTDEFIKPINNNTVDGTIQEGDVVIFINFRNDRAKELTIVLTQQDMPEEGMHTIKDLQYFCMTPYDANFKGVHILFPKENVDDTLGEYLSKMGKKQLHTAETEKYAHVTFFFNGGREAPFENEDRILVPSPKVATYDLKPEMSAFEVKDKLVGAINTQEYDFIVVNFANGDMVGHTGVYNAIAKAVWAVDHCVEAVIEAAKKNDYEAIIIADHGNADNAINVDGTPNTAHSLNPVPFIYVTNNNSATVKDGRLADVAPSILHIMGLEQPADMTGENLIKDN